MKKSLELFNRRFELAEERISKLDDRLLEIVQTEEQKEKINRASEKCGTV